MDTADWKCSECGWVNRGWATECNSCGAAKGDVAQAVAPPAGVNTTSGPVAVSAPAGATGPIETTTAIPTGSGFLGGLAAGAIAAVVGTATWYAAVVITDSEIGFIAIVVGWLVGSAVVFGARRRISIPLIAASGLFTLAALSVAEYLIVYHILTRELGMPIGLLEAPDFIIEVAIEGIKADPVTLLFWGIALFEAVYIPFQRMRPAGPSSSPGYELGSRAS